MFDQSKERLAWRRLGKMGEDLEPSLGQLEHANRDRRGTACFFERMRDSLSCRFIRGDSRLVQNRFCWRDSRAPLSAFSQVLHGAEA